MKKIFITGISGFVGSNLAVGLRDEFRIYGTYNRNKVDLKDCQIFKVEFADQDKMIDLIKKIKPDYIINAAGVNDFSYCQSNPRFTEDINANVCRYLIGIAELLPAHFILLSSDQVFDGGKGNYSVYSRPRPVNIYGRSKKSAEILTGRYGTKTSVLRVSELYGLGNGRNLTLFDKILRSSVNKESIALSPDTLRSFLYIKDFVEAVRLIIRRKPKYILYHIGGPSKISHYELGLIFSRLINPNLNIISEYKYKNPKELAMRGHDCSLVSDRFLNEYKMFRTLEPANGIIDCIETLRKG